MCGFAGRINFKKNHEIDKAEIKSMCDAIAHRGPDDEGYYIKGNVGLGHRRLSIIDLNTGQQPIYNEDKSIVIVFNGEIYNYRELRNELSQKGHLFKTETDTEVIVHLYEEYQESCVQKMNGMFSFAIWDSRNEKLFLARDRIGIKPLYYYTDKDKIVFGSEMKAIIQVKSVERQIDLSSIDQYLSFGYIPSPLSIFEKIKKLPPGHHLSIQGDSISMKKFWDIRYEYRYDRSEDEDAENIVEILKSSVQMRLVSDVPLGAFLSGGIDSSAVVAMMSKLINRPVKTFSIGFKEAKFNELEDARFIAKKFNTEHYEEIVDPDSVNLVPKLVWYYDEPFADSSAIPTYYVSRLAREHVTVVLSGDGGDELFGGYLRYITSNRDKLFLRLPARIRKDFLGAVGRILPNGFKGKNYFNYISLNDLQRYMVKVGCFPEHIKQKLYTRDFAASIGKKAPDHFSAVIEKDLVTKLMFYDCKTYLPDDILVKVDKASMARSLEARVPVLDYRLIEYAATIPPERKINGDNQKMIFKKALKQYLPERVFTKKKQGFGVPLEDWFRCELREMAYDTLLSNTALQRGYFQMNQVKYLLDEHQGGNRDNSFYIWALLMLELWHKQFVDSITV